MAVGNRLRQVRRERGLTQASLARLAGLTRQTIISIEKGRRVPSVEVALVLARVLERPVEAIFRLADDRRGIE